MLTVVPTASQKNPREVQPVPGCGQPEQASRGSILHGSPDLPAHCNPGLLYHPTFHDGVRRHNGSLLFKPGIELLSIHIQNTCVLFIAQCIQYSYLK